MGSRGYHTCKRCAEAQICPQESVSQLSEEFLRSSRFNREQRSQHGAESTGGSRASRKVRRCPVARSLRGYFPVAGPRGRARGPLQVVLTSRRRLRTPYAARDTLSLRAKQSTSNLARPRDLQALNEAERALVEEYVATHPLWDWGVPPGHPLRQLIPRAPQALQKLLDKYKYTSASLTGMIALPRLA